jgi:hypothetical protein
MPGEKLQGMLNFQEKIRENIYEKSKGILKIIQCSEESSPLPQQAARAHRRDQHDEK